jgi:hypothetical protein
LPELQIGAVNRSGIEAWAGAIEFADMDRSERIDGLLGLDVLRETNLSIDYEARTVTFGPVSHSNDPIPFYRGLPIVTVPLMVQGRSVRLLLDTAAKDVLLYESRDLRRFSMSRTGEVKPIRHIGGRFPSERVKILQIALGQSRWKEMSAFLVKGVAREESPDGVLGPSALGLKRLHLDFMRGLISWE